MVSLQAKFREKFGRQTNNLRKRGLLPGVLYGEGIKGSVSLQVPEKEFEKVFQEAGETSLINLQVNNKKYDALIHQIAKDPLTGKFLHVDFFRPSSKKKIKAEAPLIFEGEAAAVRELSGTLVRELQVVEVKGLAHKLPREIRVDVETLKTFEDKILIKDLKLPAGVEILRTPEEIVAHVAPPKKVEEKKPEEKPVEEKKEAKEKKVGESTLQKQ